MNDDITVIKVPPVTFAFGDRKDDVLGARVLYGPENEQGERKVVALVQDSAVELLEIMLEYADAHMSESDREL